MPAGMTPDLGAPETLARLFAPAQGRRAIGLAVSGGADSLALMLLARRWAQSLHDAPKLVVYSVDHQLRPEAAQEVAYVVATARQLGLDARVLVWSGEKPDTGLQEAARQARYRLLASAMHEDGADLLLTGHHRADQAETVLMRMAHGSGVEGLKAMTPLSEVDGVQIFRPLLDVEPAILASIVAEAGLVPVHDPSNDDADYERVRWRRLLPSLAGEGLDSAALSRFAFRMAEADAALAQMAEAAFTELVTVDGFGAASIPVTTLTDLSPAVGRRVLGRVLRIVGGGQKPRALGPVERLYDQAVAGELGRAVTLLGAVARVKAETLFVSREPGRALPEDRALEPHRGLVWDNRFRITNASNAEDLVAVATDFMPRHRLEDVLGFKVTTPAEAIRTSPLVRDSAGGVLALGGWSFDDRVKVEVLVD